MAKKINPLTFHVQSGKISTPVIFIAAVLVGLLYGGAQMHQRQKSDFRAALEGKIPLITLNKK